MFVANGASRMHCVDCVRKEVCGNFMHIACKIHALDLVAETIMRLQ